MPMPIRTSTGLVGFSPIVWTGPAPGTVTEVNVAPPSTDLPRRTTPLVPTHTVPEAQWALTSHTVAEPAEPISVAAGLAPVAPVTRQSPPPVPIAPVATSRTSLTEFADPSAGQ